MSFSKSGRPRKRNKRLCQDEYEVFSPGSGFSDSTVSIKKTTSKPIYKIVIERPKKSEISTDKKYSANAIRNSISISAKSLQSPVAYQVANKPAMTPQLLLPAQPRLSNTVISGPPQRTIVLSQSSIVPAQTPRVSNLSMKSPLTTSAWSYPVKPRENLFELDFTFDPGSDTLPSTGHMDTEPLITLDLEPVNTCQESFFEPSNEEERNVFESFASLLH